MRKGINVDVYGKCGAPCPGNTEEDCLQYLSNFYTFILVFETHVCQHYLSPQLLRVLNLRQQSMIPVVFGGINYNELFSSNGLESNIYENNNQSLNYTFKNEFLRKLRYRIKIQYEQLYGKMLIRMYINTAKSNSSSVQTNLLQDKQLNK